MTISSTANRISYTGNGATTAFAYPYLFTADSDLVVIETVIATGVETTRVLTVDYTVAGAGNANGGTVTALTAPATTVTWTIFRNPPQTQTLVFVENDPLPANDLNTGFDKLTMIAQRLNELSTRTVRQPDGDTADISVLPSKVSRASNFLAFDAGGEPIAAAGTSANLGPVSTYIDTLLDDVDAPTARGTLGLVIGTDVLAPGGLLLQGKHTIGVPAGAMRPATTNGCAALAQSETAVNKVNFEHLDFDATTQEYAYIKFPAPKSSDETAGFIVRNLKWSHAAGATAFNVIWQFDMLALGNGDGLDSTFGAAITVTDTGSTAETLWSAPESTVITPRGSGGGSWSEGNTIWLRVSRKAADAGDTLNVDARLHELELLITYNAGTDA